MRQRRPRASVALATLLAFSVVTTTAISAESTRAAWLDTEWVSSSIGTLDCAVDSDQFSSRSSGRLLSGDALTLDLDGVAELRGVEVQNSGLDVVADPPPPVSDPVGNNTYVNPLDVGVLSALNVNLGNLLALPLNTDAGVLNHYAQSQGDGRSTGAAGAINNTGGIQLAPVSPGSERPTLATVQLGQLLSAITGSGLGGGIANLTDARLEVGAVASRASLNACSSQWSGDVYNNLAREYLVSALRLNVDSPLVAGLASTTQATVGGVETSVESLAGNAGVLTAVTAGVTALVSGLLSTLQLGQVSISNLNVTIDLSTVSALLDDTISDDAGIVAIDLATGTVTIDLAGLLGAVEGSDGVNGLAPNTQLLINASVVNALTLAVTQALTNWVTDVTAALSSALQTLTVSAKVAVGLRLATLPLATITLTIPPSPLSALLAGTVKATSTTTLLGGGACGVLNALGCLVDSVVAAIVVPLTNGIGKTLGSALNTAVFQTTGTGGVLTTTTATMRGLTGPLVSFVGTATRGLFGENSVLSLTVNAQNRPDPAFPSGPDVPEWAAGLPGPDPATKTSGQYDVSALRLTTLGILGPGLNVDVDFARSSVGSNSVNR